MKIYVYRSGPEIYSNFTTLKGKRMSLSMIFRLLKNEFYYGSFMYDKVLYEGSHDPIISKQMFDDTQEQLKTDPKIYGIKEFQFVKLFKCGACGSGITAQEKTKYRKDGSFTKYIYYNCTRKKDLDCKQQYTREESILEQLIELIDKVSIKRLGMRDKIEKEIERYEMFTTNVLDKKETGAKKQVSKVSIRKYAKFILQKGSRDEKRELLKHLKSELMLKDKVLYLK